MDTAKYRQADAAFWRSVGEAPEERVVDLPRIGTSVRVQDVGAGPSVLFLHGGPNAGSAFAPMIPRFHGFRSLLVDRPGTGLSEAHPIDADSLPEFGAFFVGDVLDGLGIERAHLVGSSFGAHLAIRSAAAEPDRVDRMVLLSAPAFAQGDRTPPFMKLLKYDLVRKIVNALPPNERANRSIMRQIGHGKTLDAGALSEDFSRWYLELLRHTDTMRNDGDMIARLIAHRDKVELSDDLLGAVRAPTLFLWGSDDSFGGEGVAQKMVASMPNAELKMIADAGHLPWLDDPDGIAAAGAEFLNAGTVEN